MPWAGSRCGNANESHAQPPHHSVWSAITANHQDLLARLAAHHPVVLLSGDVHYGFTSRLTRTEGAVTTRAAQLTASAAKNLEVKNAAISIFSELAMRLGLERVRDGTDEPRVDGQPVCRSRLVHPQLDSVG